MHDWLRWVRRAHDTGDGAPTTAFAAILDAAEALLRIDQSEAGTINGNGGGAGGGGGGGGGAGSHAASVFNEDDLTSDVLLWPWGTGAEEAPVGYLRAGAYTRSHFSST